MTEATERSGKTEFSGVSGSGSDDAVSSDEPVGTEFQPTITPAPLGGAFPFAMPAAPLEERTTLGPELEARIDANLREGLERHVYSGVALGILNRRGLVYKRCLGKLDFESERHVTSEILFDLASLTKILFTTTLCLQALGHGELRIDEELRGLLTHSGGYPASGARLDQVLEDPRELSRYLRDLPPAYEPGTQIVYSCYGFMRLGELLRVRVPSYRDRSWEALLSERIKAPLGLERLYFNPLQHGISEDEIVATRDLDSGALLHGESYEPNARFLGGASCNAGLFGSLDALLEIARAHLAGGPPLIKPRVLERAIRDEHPSFAEHRGLGFFLGATRGTSLGDFATGAYGHTGVTGTSFLIHPERGLAIVYLSNQAIVPSDGMASLDLRARLHNLILSE